LKEAPTSASSTGRRARREVAARERRCGRAQVVGRAEQRASDDEGGDERGDPHAAADDDDRSVVVGLEHDESRQQDRGDRQRRAEQAEPDELQPQGGQPPQRERDHEPGRERRKRDDERIEDHGANL